MFVAFVLFVFLFVVACVYTFFGTYCVYTFFFPLSFCLSAVAQESRKHYNQLEEARKQQHKRKLKLEAQEVALGERDHVTATLGDNLYVGERGFTPILRILYTGTVFDSGGGVFWAGGEA